MNLPTVDMLMRLQPIRGLSVRRLEELARICRLENHVLGTDPLRDAPPFGQLVYLVCGEMNVTLPDGSMNLLVGGCDAATWPLGYRSLAPVASRAITDVVILRIDFDLLDRTMTWEELSSVTEALADRTEEANRLRVMASAFSVPALTGVMEQLPPAHLQELWRRFVRVPVRAGQIMMHEGDEGDYYYLIEAGRAEVLRQIGGASVLVAELKTGDQFGEEALVADVRRNATVRMKTDGILLRLAKPDFIELLRTPLLKAVSLEEAARRVAAGGAQWLDVRYAAEFAEDGQKGALNIPLNEIRSAFGLLDPEIEYIVYCQSGRRSSAATFLLVQYGFNAYWLEGGLAAANGGGCHGQH